jgi:hypothetical protein
MKISPQKIFLLPYVGMESAFSGADIDIGYFFENFTIFFKFSKKIPQLYGNTAEGF